MLACKNLMFRKQTKLNVNQSPSRAVIIRDSCVIHMHKTNYKSEYSFSRKWAKSWWKTFL